MDKPLAPEATILSCQFYIVNHRETGYITSIRPHGRHNALVFKRLRIAVPTPPGVNAATQAFGSELRVQLIHHYATHPGRQADAARALGVDRAVISANTRALVAIGVLTQDSERLVRVDRQRLAKLITALNDFCLPSPSLDS